MISNMLYICYIIQMLFSLYIYIIPSYLVLQDAFYGHCTKYFSINNGDMGNYADLAKQAAVEFLAKLGN